MTEPQNEGTTQVVTLRTAFITQFGSAPAVMTLPPNVVDDLSVSPFFKRTTLSSVGTIGTFMGMTIRAGSPLQAMDASGAQTLEIGEIE